MHGSKARADNTGGEDDAGHPNARAELAHDQVGRKVEDDIGHVKESQCGRDVSGAQSEDCDEIMVLVNVHGLSNTDVGANGGAEEV